MAHQHNVDRMVAGFREFREDENFCSSAAFILWRSLALQCAAGVRDVQGASLPRMSRTWQFRGNGNQRGCGRTIVETGTM